MKTKISKAMDSDIPRQIRSLKSDSRNNLSIPAKRYLKCVIDPQNADPHPIPTLLGGYVKDVACFKTRSLGTIKTNSASGFGFMTIFGPQGSGPYRDRFLGTKSESTYTPLVTQTNPSTANVAGLTWADAPYTAATAAPADVNYCLVGLAVYVRPISAATVMNGRIVILEDPSHINLNDFTFDELAGFPNARVVSGVDLSSTDPDLVLNWHPCSRGSDNVPHQSSSDLGQQNDFGWYYNVLANNTSSQDCDLAVAFAGDGSTSYSYEIHAVWEARGRRVKPTDRVVFDSRGMDLVLSTFGDKTESGYHEKPRKVQEVYEAHAAYHAEETNQAVTVVNPNRKRKESFAERHPIIHEVGRIAGMALRDADKYAPLMASLL